MFKTREEAINGLNEYDLIDDRFDIFRNDKEVLLEAIKRKSWCALEYAPIELKDDKEFILRVVECDGHALRLVSAKLRNDKEIILKAVEINENFIIYASKEIRNLCKDKDPVETIKTEIAKEYAEKLQSELSTKQNQIQNKKLKV